MSEFRRHLMKAVYGGGGVLPSGYTQKSLVRAKGDCIRSIPFVFLTDFNKIVTDFDYEGYVTPSGFTYAYGNGSNGSNAGVCIGFNSSNVIVASRNGWSLISTGITAVYGENYHTEQTGSYVSINGTSISLSSTNVTTANFSILGTRGGSQCQNVLLKNFELYNDDTLVAKFIPCVEDTTSKAGMYEIVGGVFYTSNLSNGLEVG